MNYFPSITLKSAVDNLIDAIRCCARAESNVHTNAYADIARDNISRALKKIAKAQEELDSLQQQAMEAAE